MIAVRSLLMVVPARNESSTIVSCIEKLSYLRDDLLNLGTDMSVLVVINNSSDDTAALALKAASGLEWVCVETTEGRGKGLAVLHGWSYGTDMVGFSDADLAADISIVPELVSKVANGASLATASRYCSNLKPKRSIYRSTASRVYRLASRFILGFKVADAQCGLKIADINAIRPELDACQETGWLLDSELIFYLTKSRKSIEEVPVAWTAGTESQLRFWSTSRQVLSFLRRLYLVSRTR